MYNHLTITKEMNKKLYITPQAKVYAVRSENLMDFVVSNEETGSGFEFAKPNGTTGGTGTSGTQLQIHDVWED